MAEVRWPMSGVETGAGMLIVASRGPQRVALAEVAY